MTIPQVNLTVAPNGRLVIPASMRAAIGLRDGGEIVAKLVDGAVVLQPLDAAIREAQARVAKYVPAGMNLVGELIAERRAAADRE